VFFVNNKIYIAFLLNSQAQGVSGKYEQSTQTPWRGAQCSCIGLRPALLGQQLFMLDLSHRYHFDCISQLI